MKIIACVLTTVAFLAITGFGQNKSIDSGILNQQIAALYRQGKFDDAIPIAEKVVANEKKAAKNTENHALALANLAQLYKEKAKLIRSRMAQIDARDRFRAAQTSRDAADSAKKLYREALDIYRSISGDESAAAASAKGELAWVVYNFLVSDSIRESREQIDEAEKLYTESIATQDKLSSTPTELLLRTNLNFADFYMRYVNFEKAIPLYERYLAGEESKYGPRSEGLLPALRAFVKIYSITSRDDDAKAMTDRISGITGKHEGLDIDYPALTVRSRGIAKVKADGFVSTDFSDLDASFSSARASTNAITPRNQYSMKTLAVNVVVNENGDVIDAKAATLSKYSKQIEEAAMASKIRPFSYKGVPQNLRGKIMFSYREF